MSTNVFINPLKTFDYQANVLECDPTRGVNLHEIRLRINALVTIEAGGGNDGTLVEDGVARLIDSVRFVHDGFDYVEPLRGDYLLHLGRRLKPRVVAMTGLPNAGIQSNTPISVDLVIPFSWGGFANPYEVFFPAMAVNQQLRLYIQLATGRTNATDSPGTAALVTGGDRVITISNFTLAVSEVYSIASGVAPQFVPVITLSNTAQFVAAARDLEYKLLSPRRIAFQMFMNRYGPLELMEPGNFNAMTMLAGNVRWINNMPYADLKVMEQENFPAVPDPDPGIYFHNYIHNGRLGTALNPRTMGSDPKWIFDVPAPTANPGVVKVLSYELRAIPGVTLVGA